MKNLDTKNCQILAKERRRNDALRMSRIGGEIACTNSVYNLPRHEHRAIIKAVCEFNSFDDEKRQSFAHDYGVLTVDGRMVIWKIESHDVELEFPAYDAAPLDTEVRVLMIMLAEEY